MQCVSMIRLYMCIFTHIFVHIFIYIYICCFKKICFYFMYMCMYMHQMETGAQGNKKRVLDPIGWSYSYVCTSLPFGCWGLNPGLQEQQG